MKILIVAPQNRKQEVGFYLADSFNELGHTAYLFFYRDVAQLHNTDLMNSHLLGYEHQLEPDLALILKGELIKPETIKKFNSKTALWYFDLEINDDITNLAKEADTFFLHCNDTETVEYYKKEGVNIKILHQACPEKYYHPVPPDENFKSDICFIGSKKAKREEILIEVFEYCRKNNLILKIWGNGWQDSKLKEVWQGKDIYHEDFCKAVCSAKINLGLGYGEFFNRDISFRLFQILGCGGFLLHDCVKEITKLYDGGLRFFYSEKYPTYTLTSEIDYFLRDDALRLNISDYGYKHTLKNHTYTKRIKQLLEVMK